MKVWMFDIDGTLITSAGAGQEATFAAFGEAFGVPVSRGGIEFAGRTDRAIAADVFLMHSIPDTTENWEVFQRVYLEQLRGALKSRDGKVLAGVHDVLAQLVADPESHVGLLTGNVRAGAEQKLSHYRLLHHFAFGGFGDRHLSRDHVAQEALDAACDHLHQTIAPEDVWVVGDTVNDIRCARAIGANVVAVATGGASAEELQAAAPDVLLENLTTLNG